MARKNLIDKDLLDKRPNPIDQLNTHILVERIKNDYTKDKENLSAINHFRDLIALLLSCKLSMNLLNSTIDPGVITKILNK